MAKNATDLAGAFFHPISCHRLYQREMEGFTDMVACWKSIGKDHDREQVNNSALDG